MIWFFVPLGKIDVDSSTVLTQSYHLMAEFVQKMFLGGISFSIYTHKVKNSHVFSGPGKCHKYTAMNSDSPSQLTNTVVNMGASSFPLTTAWCPHLLVSLSCFSCFRSVSFQCILGTMMWGNVCLSVFLCVFYTQNTHTKLTIETEKNMDKIKAFKNKTKKQQL